MATNNMKRVLFQALTSSRAMNKGSEQARYANFATISSEGHPSCRTIVVRQVEEDERIVVCTDVRSRKIKELNQHPVAELCWWFPASKEQYRIRGKVEIINQSHSNATMQTLRHDVWSKLTPPSRSQFDQAAPGTILKSEAKSDLDKYESQTPSGDRVSDNFALLILTPQQVDYVYLPKAVVSIHPFAIEQYAASEGLNIGARDTDSQGRWLLIRDGEQWQVSQLQP